MSYGAKSSPLASVWETNRRPFGARCGDDPLWIVLDNQHPCNDIKEIANGCKYQDCRYN
ncbi:hypothetical protein P4S95_04165 [Aneurinibacillus aneurinilyticus]|uniref:hypothetical protein n=1 Tax=Aneurinibacillus aneurinilyticus TaxID=1391 RepID=UPI002E1DCC33|nr:hypothetical protein [Aneurinibacillus aneurinilyticus]